MKKPIITDSPEEYKVPNSKTFLDELTNFINRHSQENASNTPDFILAQYLEGCLKTFATAVQQRETYHGRDPRPTQTS